MMNEITCKVCGDKFTPFKSRRYEVRAAATLMGEDRIYEAFDCPMCGCQHIVNQRYPKIGDEETETNIIVSKMNDLFRGDYK